MENNPFRKALKLFDGGKGWTQGAYHQFPSSEDKQHQYCSSGALGYPTHHHQNAISILSRVLAEQYPNKNRVLIAGWNDEPHRTFAEVEAIFEKCAIRWDEEYGM